VTDSAAGALRVGFIGIGNMGFAMAARLVDLGWRVAVRDIDASRVAAAQALGARVAATPAAIGASSDCVIVVVVDAAQCEAVLFGADGAAAAMAAGSTVMLCPTMAPEDTGRFAAALARRGIDAIDAPMSGGPARARDGSMSLMLAGADAVIERHRGLIAALSAQAFHVGARIGDGARTKLVNNLLAGINLAGAAEALALAERLGLDLPRTLAVIEQSSGQSWIGGDRRRRAVAGDLSPRAHTALLEKDTHLALQMAGSVRQQMPLGTIAAAIFREACEAGGSALDDACLLERARRRNR
jgi:3-hydroxyisobutyrate dehydrogenase